MKFLWSSVMCLALCSCKGKHPALYFDVHTKAIASCTDTIKEIDIETPQSTIVVKGPIYHKPFYIGMVNPGFTILIDGELQDQYILRLQPNTSYIARSEKGDDDGQGAVTFSTDKDGAILSASKTSCN